jgi:probable HAF family extracellular repeat protein
MKNKLSVLMMAALLSLSVCININAQNLIQNGSFEQPQVSFQEHFGSWNWQSVYGWGIGGSGDIAIHNGPANGGAYGPAQDGVNYVDLSGFGVSEMHAYIYQDFATTPGVVYSLVFYTGSSSPTPTNTIRVSVFENVVGYLVNVTLTPLAQTGSICWKREVITFTAQMNSTRLQFQDSSLVDDNASYIDNVSVVQADVSYQIIDLGPGKAYSINRAGQVVGYNQIGESPSDFHAFVYTSNCVNDLGTLGGLGSIAYGINNSGRIVGTSGLDNPSGLGPSTTAFAWFNGSMANLGNISGGSVGSAFGINDFGYVVGVFYILLVEARDEAGKSERAIERVGRDGSFAVKIIALRIV